MKKPFLNAFRQMYMTQDTNMYPGIYMPNGLKPLEAHFSDIANHLVKWAARSDADQFYETEKYWYRFLFENTDVGRMSGIVWVRRFTLDSNEEMTLFANKRQMFEMRQKWKFPVTSANMVPVE